MKPITVVFLLPFLAAAACQTAQPVSDAENTDLRTMLAGKTFTNEDSTFTLHEDGSMTGSEANGDRSVGTWEVRDGQWCRTLTEPAEYAGTGCRDVAIDGDEVTFTRGDGASITYTIE